MEAVIPTRKTKVRSSSAAKKRPATRRRRRSPGEPLDLSEVAAELNARLRPRPADYTRGKTKLRDEVMSLLECSALRAEHVVDNMVKDGYARFDQHPRFAGDARYGVWNVDARS